MANQLPDILKVKPNPVLSNLEIDSHILEPEVNNSRHITFKLPRVGILDQGSQLQIGIIVPQVASADHAFFPGLTGVGALIEKAELEVAGKVLCTTDDFGFYHTMRRSFKHPEERALVDAVREGSFADRVAYNTDTAKSGLLALRDVEYGADTTTAAVPKQLIMTSDQDTSPLFVLSLSQLFPAFTSKQIPLFALKDHMLIKITLRNQTPGDDAERGLVYQSNQTITTANMPQFTINFKNTKFVYDALHYNHQTMADVTARAMSDDGLSMIYEDLILTRATLNSTTATTSPNPTVEGYNRQLAVVGKTVRNILVHEKTMPGDPNHVLGQYSTSVSTRPEEIQIRVNDTPLFTNPLVRESEKLTQLGLVMDSPPQIPSLMYSKDIGSDKSTIDQLVDLGQVPITSATVEGLAMSALYGSCHYMGFDLTKSGPNVLENGLEIKQKPIEVLRTIYRTEATTAGLAATSALDTKFYTNVERTMVMRKGEVLVSA